MGQRNLPEACLQEPPSGMAPGLLHLLLRQEESLTLQSAGNTKALGPLAGLDNTVNHCRALVRQRDLPASTVQAALSSTDP